MNKLECEKCINKSICKFNREIVHQYVEKVFTIQQPMPEMNNIIKVDVRCTYFKKMVIENRKE